jgi:hypothetical protein
MDKSLRIDVGERYLVLGVFTTLVTETVYQVLTAGMFFTWSSLIFGVVSVLAIIFLAHWLYTGSLQARKVAIAWVSFQILWVVVGLALLLSGPGRQHTVWLMGVNVVWLACIKLAAYGLFGSLLCWSDSLNAFLGYKRGEEIPERVQAEIKGEPMELPAAHEQAIDNLAGTMQAAALTLIVVGLLQMLVTVRDPQPSDLARNLGLARGLVMLGLGAILFLPLGALRALLDDPERNTGYLMRALGSLTAMSLLQALLGLALGAVIVGSVLMNVVL